MNKIVVLFIISIMLLSLTQTVSPSERDKDRKIVLGDLEGPDYIQPPKHYRTLNMILAKAGIGEEVEGPPPVPVTGTRELLVILVELSDVAPDPAHTIAYFEDRFFDTSPPSARDYFTEVSYGNFTYIPGDVLGWYPSTYDQSQWTTDKRPVVTEAIQDVDADFDFSPYDTNPADGTVTNEELTIFVIVSGDQGGASHWWTIGSVVTGDGVEVEGEFNNTHEERHIGSYVHELGHDLGLPDLYDTDDGSEGIGQYGLMGGGSWTFSHFTAWCKIQLGWLNPTVVTGCGYYDVDAAETIAEAYILIDPSHSSDEYFLIENRHPASSYYESVGAPVAPDGTYPDEGIVIYHIDESKVQDWITSGTNNVNVDEAHKGVDVETAEHPTSHVADADDLDAEVNRGDADDLWVSSEYNFRDTSVPCNANWYGATPSGVWIGDFPAAGPTMRVGFIEDLADDGTSPTITCPENIVQDTDPDVCEAVVTWTPLVDDNCPGVTYSCAPTSGSTFPLGTTQVTCTATDAAGNTDFCTFDVTIEDNQDPTIECPDDITVSAAPGECDVEATWDIPVCTDNCPGVTCACDPPSGTVFQVCVDPHPVTCTATDAAGNTSTCNFTVTANPIFTVVYVDDDWLVEVCGAYLGTGRYGEDIIKDCNGFDNLADAFANVSGSECWVYPGWYPTNATITLDGLEVYSTGGPEVTLVVDGGQGTIIAIDADNVIIGKSNHGFTFSDGHTGIEVAMNSEGAEIHHNYFCNNTYGLINDSFFDVDAERNWWCSCTGPYHAVRNPSGHGDEVIETRGAFVDFYPWLYPCAVAWGDTCLDHHVAGDPEDFLEGSGLPDQDLYAVGFYNPGGEARLTSVSFQWYDPGEVDLWVYLGPEDGCPVCYPYDGDPMLADSLDMIPSGSFIGNWEWETVELGDGPCIQIPAKRCFYIVWKMKDGADRPRILGDVGHSESYSWIWNGENGYWKCFDGYEYMVAVCLEYNAGCVEIQEPDITWSHPYRGEYPCVCDDYTVEAIFRNECDEDEFVNVAFYEAPWGLFTAPEGGALCGELIAVPAGGVDTLACACAYHHHPDHHNWWARNIVVEWTRDMNFCFEEPEPTWYKTRRCRMTIWPDGPWDKEPV
ncbi:MAG: M6 family metalloprotease domain-containing protein, partial [Gemmatimonadota bacterium]